MFITGGSASADIDKTAIPVRQYRANFDALFNFNIMAPLIEFFIV